MGKAKNAGRVWSAYLMAFALVAGVGILALATVGWLGTWLNAGMMNYGGAGAVLTGRLVGLVDIQAQGGGEKAEGWNHRLIAAFYILGTYLLMAGTGLKISP